MHFALSRHAAPPHLSGDVVEPPAARQRVSTTATLVAVALFVILAKAHWLDARPHAADATTPNDVAAPTKIVAPEFCKDQTWPYIDSRCLRRVDTPPPATEPKIVTPPKIAAPPATSASITPAPPDTAATPAPAPAVTPAPPPAATASAAAATAAPSPSDGRSRVIESVFPRAVPSAAPDSDAQATSNATADTYQPTNDSPQRRRTRHWNNHSGFFGFRF